MPAPKDCSPHGAAEAVGVSPVMLSRNVSVLDRLERIAASPAALNPCCPTRFSKSGKVAVRIHDRDRTPACALRDLRTQKDDAGPRKEQLASEPVPRDPPRGSGSAPSRSLWWQDCDRERAGAVRTLAARCVNLVRVHHSLDLKQEDRRRRS